MKLSSNDVEVGDAPWLVKDGVDNALIYVGAPRQRCAQLSYQSRR